MKTAKMFGVMNLDSVNSRSPLKVITADINIFVASDGYTLIYFNKENEQAVAIVKTVEEVQDLVKKILKKENS